MWWRSAFQAMLVYSALHGGDVLAQGQETTPADQQRSKDAQAAIKQVSAQIAAAPRDWRLYYVRGQLHRAQRNFKEALADFTKAIEIEPREAVLYEERGSASFCLGDIDNSIADFDREIKLNPQAERGHWKRGISYFYAGEFAKGQKQFEAYQTYDDSDVENAVWRFLCMVPQIGLQKSQEQILKVGPDNRVPMREIYELYAGRLQPKDVLDAVTKGSPADDVLHHRMFYARLYLGLYYEVQGNTRLAREHMEQADQLTIGHYMWDVAHVHFNRMAKADKPDAP